MDNNSRRDFLKKSSLLALASTLPASHIMAQDEPVQSSATTTGSTPYKQTYVRNVFVTDNEFRNTDPSLEDNPGFDKAREILPVPFWTGNQDAIDMYWKGWEIAFRNIKNPTEKNGFIASYLDTAYNGNIFMWDSTFITMFARYGSRAFPFQNTLDNFYGKQHPDGFICREIWGESGEDAFHRYDPVSTGPNIIPWSEMEYFEHFEDWDRIHKIFPVLSGYYQWLKLNRTWQDGSYWSSGWGTGMDNQPRLKREYNPLFSHGHMTWLDTNLQQLFIGKILVDFGFYVERWQEIEDIEDDTKFLTKYIKEKLWNPDTNFFYDRYADGSIGDFQSIGAFWALHTDLLSKNEMDSFVAHLKNPETFFRHHPIPSMPANHERYQAEGRYWQGGVWAPTNFMILSGLKSKGYNDLAFELGTLHHQRVSEVFKKTGTFFEYYAPEASEPGLLARPDFVGWTGLVPIAVLFEIIFGIKPNALKRTMTWDVNLIEEHGIEKYPYGSKGTLSLKCHARRTEREKPKIEITSDVAFRLTVNWAGQTANYEVEPGVNSF